MTTDLDVDPALLTDVYTVTATPIVEFSTGLWWAKRKPVSIPTLPFWIVCVRACNLRPAAQPTPKRRGGGVGSGTTGG